MTNRQYERDVVTARAAYADGIAEGERRATAAIVAWLQKQNWAIDSIGDWRELADMVARGDHITEAKP